LYLAVTPARAPLNLRLVQKEGQLVASWDTSTRLIEAAEDAWLRVVDGKEHLEFPLDQNALRAGSYPILALTDDVKVQLRVYLPRDKYKVMPVEESTRFIGPEAEATSAGRSEAEDAEISRLQSQLQSLREALKKQVQINQYLEARTQRARPALTNPPAPATGESARLESASGSANQPARAGAQPPRP